MQNRKLFNLLIIVMLFSVEFGVLFNAATAVNNDSEEPTILDFKIGRLDNHTIPTSVRFENYTGVYEITQHGDIIVETDYEKERVWQEEYQRRYKEYTKQKEDQEQAKRRAKSLKQMTDLICSPFILFFSLIEPLNNIPLPDISTSLAMMTQSINDFSPLALDTSDEPLSSSTDISTSNSFATMAIEEEETDEIKDQVDEEMERVWVDENKATVEISQGTIEAFEDDFGDNVTIPIKLDPVRDVLWIDTDFDDTVIDHFSPVGLNETEQEQALAVGVRTDSQVMGIYTNPDDPYTYGQYLYWAEDVDWGEDNVNGSLTIDYTSPSFAIYPRISVKENVTSEWITEILLDPAMLDLNNFYTENTTEFKKLYYELNNITLCGSQWNIINGMKIFHDEQNSIHMITELQSLDKSFIDFSISYLITSSPYVKDTDKDVVKATYNGFGESLEAQFGTETDLLRRDGFNSYYNEPLAYSLNATILAGDDRYMNYAIDDMFNVGFTTPFMYTETVDIYNESYDVLTMGMSGLSLTQGEWLEIDPSISSTVTVDSSGAKSSYVGRLTSWNYENNYDGTYYYYASTDILTTIRVWRVSATDATPTWASFTAVGPGHAVSDIQTFVSRDGGANRLWVFWVRNDISSTDGEDCYYWACYNLTGGSWDEFPTILDVPGDLDDGYTWNAGYQHLQGAYFFSTGGHRYITLQFNRDRGSGAWNNGRGYLARNYMSNAANTDLDADGFWSVPTGMPGRRNRGLAMGGLFVPTNNAGWVYGTWLLYYSGAYRWTTEVYRFPSYDSTALGAQENADWYDSAYPSMPATGGTAGEYYIFRRDPDQSGTYTNRIKTTNYGDTWADDDQTWDDESDDFLAGMMLPTTSWDDKCFFVTWDDTAADATPGLYISLWDESDDAWSDLTDASNLQPTSYYLMMVAAVEQKGAGVGVYNMLFQNADNVNYLYCIYATWTFNETPVATATADTIDADSYAGLTYTATATYTDVDGQSDLDNVYMSIGESQEAVNTFRMYYDSDSFVDDTGFTPSYVDNIHDNYIYSHSGMPNSISNGWEVVWTWVWKFGYDYYDDGGGGYNVLDVWAEAVDDSAAESGWDDIQVGADVEDDLSASITAITIGGAYEYGGADGEIEDGDWFAGGQATTTDGTVYYTGSAQTFDSDLDAGDSQLVQLWFNGIDLNTPEQDLDIDAGDFSIDFTPTAGVDYTDGTIDADCDWDVTIEGSTGGVSGEHFDTSRDNENPTPYISPASVNETVVSMYYADNSMDDLVFYAGMNNNGQTWTYDAINNIEGTFSATPAWSGSSYAAGAQYCLDFEEDDADFVSYGAWNELHQTTEMSVFLWINVETWIDSGAYGGLISQDISGSDWSFLLRTDGNGELAFLGSGDGINWDMNALTTDDVQLNLALSTWYHVGVTVNAATGVVRFYVDGDFKSTITDTIPEGYITSSLNLEMGTSESGTSLYDFDGKMDEAMIFDSVLTDDEVAALYRSSPFINSGWYSDNMGGSTETFNVGGAAFDGSGSGVNTITDNTDFGDGPSATFTNGINWNFAYTIDDADSASDDVTVTITATDNVGNSKTCIFDFTEDNTYPTTTNPSWGFNDNDFFQNNGAGEYWLEDAMTITNLADTGVGLLYGQITLFTGAVENDYYTYEYAGDLMGAPTDAGVTDLDIFATTTTQTGGGAFGFDVYTLDDAQLYHRVSDLCDNRDYGGALQFRLDQTDPVIDYNPLDDENSTYIDQGLEIGAARDYAIDEGLWGEDGWGFEENMDEFIESGDGVVSWDSDGYLKNTLQGAGAYTVLRSSGGGTNLTLNGYLYNQLLIKVYIDDQDGDIVRLTEVNYGEQGQATWSYSTCPYELSDEWQVIAIDLSTDVDWYNTTQMGKFQFTFYNGDGSSTSNFDGNEFIYIDWIKITTKGTHDYADDLNTYGNDGWGFSEGNDDGIYSISNEAAESYSNGYMELDSASNDLFFWWGYYGGGTENIGIDCDYYDTIIMRVWTNASADKDIRIFFFDSGGVIKSGGAGILLGTATQNTWTTLVAKFDSGDGWNGTMGCLRVDPGSAADQKWRFDFIKVVNSTVDLTTDMFTNYAQAYVSDEIGTDQEFWAKFDEGTGTQTYDASPEARTITEASWDTNDWESESYRLTSGSTYHFDGNADYVGLSLDGEGLETHEWTWGAWVNFDSAGASERIMGMKDTTSATASMYLVKEGNNYLYVTIHTTGDDGSWRTTQTFTSDIWYFMVVTWSGNIADDPIIYIDGESVAMTENVAPGGTVYDADELYFGSIGDSTNAANFDGYMDDAFLYSRVLYPFEIQHFYSGGINQLTIGGSIVDLGTISAVTDNVSIAGDPTNWGTLGHWVFTYNLQAAWETANGYVIEYNATDAAGNWAVATFEILLDNTAPSLTDAMSAYSEGGDTGEMYGIDDVTLRSTTSYSIGGLDIRGLAYDGTYYYVGDITSKYIKMYQASDGAFVKNIGAGSVTYFGHGVATDGTYVWTTDYNTNRKCYQYQISDGALIDSWVIPVSGNPLRIAYDGTDLWITTTTDVTMLYRVSTAGSSLSSFATANTYGNANIGIDSNGNIFIADHSAETFWKYSPTGEQLLEEDISGDPMDWHGGNTEGTGGNTFYSFTSSYYIKAYDINRIYFSNTFDTDGTITITATGSDAGVGVYGISFSPYGTNVATIDKTSGYTADYTFLADDSDTSGTITVAVWDKVGNKATDTITMIEDADAPDLSITWNFNANDYAIKAGSDFGWTNIDVTNVQDTVSGLQFVAMGMYDYTTTTWQPNRIPAWLDNGVTSAKSYLDEYIYYTDNAETTGNYLGDEYTSDRDRIRLYAADMVGNTDPQYIYVRLDRTAPSFSSMVHATDSDSGSDGYAPKNLYEDDSTGTFVFSGATDAGSGIDDGDNYQVKSNEVGTWGTAGDGEAFVQCIILIDTSNNIWYNITDAVGNSVTGDTTVDIYYGTTDPSGMDFDITESDNNIWISDPSDIFSGTLFYNSGEAGTFVVSMDASGNWQSGGAWKVVFEAGFGVAEKEDDSSTYDSNTYDINGASDSSLTIKIVNNCGEVQTLTLTTTDDTTDPIITWLVDQTNETSDYLYFAGVTEVDAITNGGFETGDYTGWTIESGSPIIRTGAWANFGTYGADLSYDPSEITQDMGNISVDDVTEFSFYWYAFNQNDENVSVYYSDGTKDTWGSFAYADGWNKYDKTADLDAGKYIHYVSFARTDSSGNLCPLDDIVLEYNTYVQYGYYSDNMGGSTNTFNVGGSTSDGGAGLNTITDNTAFGDNPTDTISGAADLWSFAYAIDENDDSSGSFNVTYTTTDLVGNSITDWFYFYLDNDAPTTTFESITENTPHEYIYATGQTVYFSDLMSSTDQLFTVVVSATDGGSDLYAVEFSVWDDDSDWNDTASDYERQYSTDSTETSGSINIFARDNVGNFDASPVVITMTEDTTAPTTTFSSITENAPHAYIYYPGAGQEIWFSDEMDATDQLFTAVVTAADGGSDLYAVEFSGWDGSAWNDTVSAYSRQYTTDSSETSGSINIFARDNVGNVDATPVVITMTEDTTEPTTTFSSVVEDPASDYLYISGQIVYFSDLMSSTDVFITITATMADGGSGIYGIEMSAWDDDVAINDTDGTYVRTYSTDSSETSGSITFTARDLVGNVDSTPVTITMTEDITAPTTTFSSITENAPHTYIYNTGQTVYFSDLMGATDQLFTVVVTAADGGSDLYAVEFSVWDDDNNWNDTSATYSRQYSTDSSETTGSINIFARDNVGNYDTSAVVITMTEDTTDPIFSVTWNFNTNDWFIKSGSDFRFNDIDITSLNDTGSGMQRIYLRLWNGTDYNTGREINASMNGETNDVAYLNEYIYATNDSESTGSYLADVYTSDYMYVLIYSYDMVLNAYYQIIYVRLDRTAPDSYTVLMESGYFDADVTNDSTPTVTISGFNDNGGSGLHSTSYVYNWRNDSGSWTNFGYTASTTHTPSVNESQDTDFGVYARDAVGNTGSWVYDNDNTVDLSNPSIDTISASESSDYLYYQGSGDVGYYSSLMSSAVTFSVTGTASDNYGLELINASSFGDTPSDASAGTYQLDFTIEASDNGNEIITVYLYDQAGNVVTDTFTLNEDNTAPTTTFSSLVENPDSDYQYISGQTIFFSDLMGSTDVIALLTVTAADGDSDLYAVEFSAWDQFGDWNDTASVYARDYYTDSTETSGSVTAFARDNVGNYDATPVTITMTEDITAPTTTFSSITENAPHEYIYATGQTVYFSDLMSSTDQLFTAVVTASDGGSDLYAVEFSVWDDDTDWNDTASAYSRQYSTDSTETSGSINIFARDNVGNYDASPVVITMTEDTTAPTTTFSSVVEDPASDYLYITGQTVYFSDLMSSTDVFITITVTAADGGSDVYAVEFSAWDDESVINDTDGTYIRTYSIDSSETSGSITLFARDNVGNYDASSVTITMTEDVTAPTTTFSSLVEDPASDYQYISGQTYYFSDLMSSTDIFFTVTVTAADGGSDVYAVEMSAWDDDTVINDTDGTYVRTYSTDSSETSGSITLFARDNVGNYDVTPVTITMTEDITNPSLTDVFSGYQESGDTGEVNANLTENIYFFSNSFDTDVTATFFATGTDSGVGIYAIQFSAFGADSASNDTTAGDNYGASYTINDDDVTGSITVTIFDKVGNIVSGSITMTEDAVGPSISVTWNFVANDWFIKSGLDFGFVDIDITSVQDTVSGLDWGNLYFQNDTYWAGRTIVVNLYGTTSALSYLSEYCYATDDCESTGTYSGDGYASNSWAIHMDFRDMVGNTLATTNRYVRLDRTAPTVTDLTMESGYFDADITNDTTPLLTTSATDAGSDINSTGYIYAYRTDAGAWTNGSWTVSTYSGHTITSSQDVDFYVCVRDVVGNEASFVYDNDNTVDLVDPAFTNIGGSESSNYLYAPSSTTDYGYYSDNMGGTPTNFLVIGDITDNYGLETSNSTTHFADSPSDSSITGVSDSFSLTFTIDSSDVGDGTQVVTVWIYDEAGNVVTDTFTFYEDNVSPTGSVTWNYNINDWFIKSGTDYGFTDIDLTSLQDVTAGLNNIVIRFRNVTDVYGTRTLYSSMNGNNTDIIVSDLYCYGTDDTELTGNYYSDIYDIDTFYVEISARDECYNGIWLNRYVRLDRTAPTVTDLTMESGYFDADVTNDSTPLLTASATDAGSDINSTGYIYAYRVDAGGWTNGSWTVSTYSGHTIGSSQDVDFYVCVRDVVGNEASFVYDNDNTVDLVNPSIDSVSASESSDYLYYVSGQSAWYGSAMSSAVTFSVTGTASDNFNFETINATTAFGDDLEDLTPATFSIDYTIESSDNGNITITLYLFDEAGNYVTDTFEFYEDNTDPDSTFTSITETSVYMYTSGQTLWISDGMGATPQTATMAVTSTDYGHSGLYAVQFSVFGDTAASNDTSVSYSADYGISSNEISGSIVITAVDNVGNWETTITITIIDEGTGSAVELGVGVDTIVESSLYLYAPDNETFWYSNRMFFVGDQDVTFDMIYTYNGSAGISHVNTSIAWWDDTPSDGSAPYSLDFDVPYYDPAEGQTGTMYVQIWTNTGVSSNDTVTINKDFTNPTFAWSAGSTSESSDYLYYDGSSAYGYYSDNMGASLVDFILGGTASDGGSGLQYVYDDTTFGNDPANDTSSPWSLTYSIDSSDISFGNLTIILKALDNVGNPSGNPAITFTFYLDDEDPWFNYFDYGGSDWNDDCTSLSGWTQDTGTRYYDMMVDSGAFTPQTPPSSGWYAFAAAQVRSAMYSGDLSSYFTRIDNYWGLWANVTWDNDPGAADIFQGQIELYIYNEDFEEMLMVSIYDNDDASDVEVVGRHSVYWDSGGSWHWISTSDTGLAVDIENELLGIELRDDTVWAYYPDDCPGDNWINLGAASTLLQRGTPTYVYIKMTHGRDAPTDSHINHLRIDATRDFPDNQINETSPYLHYTADDIYAYYSDNMVLGNVIINGDFETGDLTGWTAVDIGYGASSVAGGEYRIYTGSYGCQISPYNTTEPSDYDPAYIEQNISDFAVGLVYEFSYWTRMFSGGGELKTTIFYTDGSNSTHTTVYSDPFTDWFQVDLLASLTAGKTINKTRFERVGTSGALTPIDDIVLASLPRFNIKGAFIDQMSGNYQTTDNTTFGNDPTIYNNASCFWVSYEIDVNDNNHVIIQFNGTDNVGNNGTLYFTFYEDLSVTMTLHTDDITETSSYLYYDGSSTYGYYSDNMGVTPKSFIIDGTSSDALSGLNATMQITDDTLFGGDPANNSVGDWAFDYSIDQDNDSYSTFTVTYRVYDNVYNTNTVTFQFILDNDDPTLTWLAAQTNETSTYLYYNGSAQWGYYSDNMGGSTDTFNVGGSSSDAGAGLFIIADNTTFGDNPTEFVSGASSLWSFDYTIDENDDGDGSFNVTYTVIDRCANYITDWFYFYLDNDVPTTTFTWQNDTDSQADSYAPNQYWDDDGWTSWNVSETADTISGFETNFVEFWLSNETFTVYGSSPWFNGTYEEGTFTVYYNITDAVGNTIQGSNTHYVDTTLPIIDGLDWMATVEPNYFNQGSNDYAIGYLYYTELNPWEAYFVTTPSLTCNNDLDPIYSATRAQINITITGQSDGTYDLSSHIIRDKAGNIDTTMSVLFNTDFILEDGVSTDDHLFWIYFGYYRSDTGESIDWSNFNNTFILDEAYTYGADETTLFFDFLLFNDTSDIRILSRDIFGYLLHNETYSIPASHVLIIQLDVYTFKATNIYDAVMNMTITKYGYENEITEQIVPDETVAFDMYSGSYFVTILEHSTSTYAIDHNANTLNNVTITMLTGDTYIFVDAQLAVRTFEMMITDVWQMNIVTNKDEQSTLPQIYVYLNDTLQGSSPYTPGYIILSRPNYGYYNLTVYITYQTFSVTYDRFLTIESDAAVTNWYIDGVSADDSSMDVVWNTNKGDAMLYIYDNDTLIFIDATEGSFTFTKSTTVGLHMIMCNVSIDNLDFLMYANYTIADWTATVVLAMPSAESDARVNIEDSYTATITVTRSDGEAFAGTVYVNSTAYTITAGSGSFTISSAAVAVKQWAVTDVKDAIGDSRTYIANELDVIFDELLVSIHIVGSSTTVLVGEMMTFAINVTSRYTGAPPTAFTYALYRNHTMMTFDSSRSLDVSISEVGKYLIRLEDVKDTTYGITKFTGGYAGFITVIDELPSSADRQRSTTSDLFGYLAIIIAILVIYWVGKGLYNRYKPQESAKTNSAILNSTPRSYAKKKK